MNIIFLIRSLIFLVAGLILLIFPKPILEWQLRWNVKICKWFHKKYDVENNRASGKKTNMFLGYTFLVVSAILFLVAIQLG